MAYGFSLGGSYAINKMWSVAAAARYVYSTREFDGQATIASSVPGLDPPLTPEHSTSRRTTAAGRHTSA